MKGMGPYRLGLGLQNVFHQKTGDTDDKLPVIIKVGNSLRLFKERLTLALDGNKPLTGAMEMRFGGEYWLARWFAFRFGLMGLPEIQETDFGFGLNFRSFSLDMAQGLHDLGSSTRMSATFRFGQSKGDRSTAQVRNFMKQGMEAFQDGNFALAAQKFNQALDAQPDNKQVQAMLARLMTVTGFVRRPWAARSSRPSCAAAPSPTWTAATCAVPSTPCATPSTRTRRTRSFWVCSIWWRRRREWPR